MNHTEHPHKIILKDIFLAGGGHAHALLIKKFAMSPLPGVRLNLISERYQTPYSGMLPGLISGHYEYDDAHIDLAKLCQWSQVRFFCGKIRHVDLDKQLVYLPDHPPLSWDLISINTGSTPIIPKEAGFNEYCIPIKPIANFIDRLESFSQQLQQTNPKEASIVVVGGGVAGIEVAFSLRERFAKAFQNCSLRISIAHSGGLILPELGKPARKLIERRLAHAGISVIYHAKLESLSKDHIKLKGLGSIPCNFCVVCSHAMAPTWPRESNLKVNEDGFILVNPHLQSVSHPLVFSAGDIAHFGENPLPKAGVYAVRQAECLSTNIKRMALGQRLVKFKAQRNFLKIIGTGNGTALAAKSSFHFFGNAPWKWKQKIDLKFMAKLSPDSSWLKHMPKPRKNRSRPFQEQHSEDAKTLALAQMRCSGCAAKWDEGVLANILDSLRSHESLRACLQDPDQPDLLLKNDDAAVLKVKPGFDLVQSIDFMPCMTSNPFLFGRILVNHSFNDIYAMGGIPHSAQALLMLPYAKDKIAAADGKLLIQGIATQIIAEGFNIKLVGGHTCEGTPLSAGLVCNGLVKHKAALYKGGLQAGDQLILTKGLGTGVIFAAAMRLAAHPSWVEEASKSMLLSHSKISSGMSHAPSHGATDISGFGLLGHLLEMQFAARKNVHLDLAKIPLLKGALECLKKGIRSSIHHKNASKAKMIQEIDAIAPSHVDILFDPQTSGPLLLSIPSKSAKLFLSYLKTQGFKQAAIIGEVCEHWTPSAPIRLKNTDTHLF